ncbi:MAG: sensor histidine kinase RegB [Sulfitobacter sp.]
MTQAGLTENGVPQRANWIRLRTMILLRWVAIAGQLAAVSVAPLVLGIELAQGMCYLVIGAAVIFNLAASFIYPENKRLTERENMFAVMFDLLQLGLLLFLTGGLNNPFALLLLGPVTISATALSLRSTLVLGALAIGIVTVLSMIYVPLITAGGGELRMAPLFIFGHWIAMLIAVLFTSAYSRRVTSEIYSMSEALSATQMALARAQKLTDLGGVVAAAAHELGTPLATIKLASGELVSELQDRPELREDAELIYQQADRCRDILRDMGRAGKDDLHLRQAPLAAVVEEAAEPHMQRGKAVRFVMRDTASSQPSILRRPEIIHGLRNLVQNAVDFASSEVVIEQRWTDERITIRIVDDGPGFPAHLIGRIGDPFMGPRKRNQEDPARPEYEGMGLGLFIAKTLLERSGATLEIANRAEAMNPRPGMSGVVIEVRWPRGKIEAQEDSGRAALGLNKHFE